MVQVAFTQNAVEGEMIRGLLEAEGIPSLLQPTSFNGPMVGVGLLPVSAQRVMVHPEQAPSARELLTETLVDDGQSVEAEIANATHLEETQGRQPRNYGVIGAYARAWVWSIVVFAVAFAVFLLLRGT